MTGFVIPFKSKKKSKNYLLDCALLNRTISSLLNQTSQNFKAYVVYSDLPDRPLQHQNIKWIQYPYPFLESHELEDEELFITRYGLGKNLPLFFDQGKKSLYGAFLAKTDNCDFIMSLDGDDLVSNKLVAFIDQHGPTEDCGWFANTGYMFMENSLLLLKIPTAMNYTCGSVNIVRSNLVPVPDFSSTNYERFNFFSAHAYVVDRMEVEHHKILKPLPFYSIVYVVHSTNFVAQKTDVAASNIKSFVKRIIRGKIVTASVKKEFGIYKLDL